MISCESTLHSVVTKVEDALRGKQIALGAFLDIEGAFDNTPTDTLVNALVRRGTGSAISGWVGAMLGSRIILAKVGNHTMRIQAAAGCPQGGVLSPLLWSLVVDELLKLLNESGFDTTFMSRLMLLGQHIEC